MANADKLDAAPIAFAPPRERKVAPYQRLKQAILEGGLEPGQQLVESALAEWCQVSRTPIREALTRLEQDGLVERGDRGLIVRASVPDEIIDIYETRMVLESAAARMAADRRTSHDLIHMRRMLARTREVADDDPKAMAASNVRLHRVIWQAAHNSSLIDLLERLNMHLGRYPATTLSYPGRWAKAKTEHDQLVAAIEARDGARAAEIASQHFTAARDIRLRLFDDD